MRLFHFLVVSFAVMKYRYLNLGSRLRSDGDWHTSSAGMGIMPRSLARTPPYVNENISYGVFLCSFFLLMLLT